MIVGSELVSLSYTILYHNTRKEILQMQIILENKF